MMEFYNMFGGRLDFSILFQMMILLLLVNSLIKNRYVRGFFSLLSSIYVVAQTVSLYSTQEFIGYQFYVHANLRGVAGMEGLFVKEIIIGVLVFAALFSLYYGSHRFIHKLLSKKVQPKYLNGLSLLTIGILLFGITSKGDFMKDTQTLSPLFGSDNLEDFSAVLEKYGMSDYVTPEKIQSSKGKNIIVISMESIETAFLNGKYASLTPNLNALKKKWNFFNLEPNMGSNWTSGSLYTYLTGFPAFFGASGNSIFQTAYHSNISSISHLLNQADYTTSYMNGNADHSGVKEMLNVLEFDRVIDYKNVEPTGFESAYGLRDKDLFELAKTELKNLKEAEEPYALFLSTTDTHFPNGIYDERMESVISPKATDLEFTIASLDYLIGDFISFLEESDVLENTTIYLFPDHLKMGDPSMFDDPDSRSLYCITNSFDVSYSQPLYQIDLPKVILKGAGIDHNLKFLTDYIEGDKAAYVADHVLPLTEINTNGILISEIEGFTIGKVSPHYEDYKKDTLRFIAHAGGEVDGNTYTNSLEALNYNYDRGFRLFELDIIQTKEGDFVAAHYWEEWAMLAGYEGELPATKEDFLSYKLHNRYTPLDMDSINQWFTDHPDAILVSDKINSPREFSNAFIDKNRLMMELFDEESVAEGLDCEILAVIPSQSVVDDLKVEEVKAFAERGIWNIAVSRRFIKDNEALLEEIKKNKINTYVYNVNLDEGMDEEYVAKYELDFVYGMYADKWSFE